MGIVVGAYLGYALPEFWLGGRVKKRQKAILMQIPDALDLLTISVRAGLGFDGALGKVVEKLQGPLTEEFRRALAEIRVGKPRRDALRDIVPRTEVTALTNFIGAIIQAEQLGVSISKVLQVQSEQLRIERRQRAEEMAAKAPIKMLFPLVGCIFPSLFIVILGPAIILIIIGLARARVGPAWAPAPARGPAVGAADPGARRRRGLARNLDRGTVLVERLETAGSLWGKFMGLMGRPSLPAGDGLWLPASNGIHMMFMRFPIDAVFVSKPEADGARRVKSVHRGLRAWTGSCGWSAARTACWSCPWAPSMPREPPWATGWRSARGRSPLSDPGSGAGPGSRRSAAPRRGAQGPSRVPAVPRPRLGRACPRRSGPGRRRWLPPRGSGRTGAPAR